MSTPRPVWLSLAVLLLCLGCAGAPPPAAEEPLPPGPDWLAGIAEGDILTYHVTRMDGDTVPVRLRVERMLKRGQSVAAHIVPTNEIPAGVAVEAHWLAGDDRGLTQVAPAQDVRDPQFVPLDSTGRVVAVDEDGRGAVWGLPADWAPLRDESGRERAALAGGWQIDELDLHLEGPVRGDRCARLSRRDGEETTRLLICANVGMVRLERTRDDTPTEERWQLVEIGHAVGDRM